MASCMLLYLLVSCSLKRSQREVGWWHWCSGKLLSGRLQLQLNVVCTLHVLEVIRDENDGDFEGVQHYSSQVPFVNLTLSRYISQYSSICIVIFLSHYVQGQKRLCTTPVNTVSFQNALVSSKAKKLHLMSNREVKNSVSNKESFWKVVSNKEFSVVYSCSCIVGVSSFKFTEATLLCIFCYSF